MSSEYKEHVKSLKAPDQFQVAGLKIVGWVNKNTRLLLLAAAPVVVAAVAFVIYQYMQNQRKASRLEDLGKVDAVYDTEARKASDERQVFVKKIQEIDAKLAPKDGSPEAPPATPTAAQTAEKAALEKQAKAIKANHAASTAQYVAFFKANDNPEGWVAGLTAARLYIEDEKISEARPLLEEVIAKAKNHPFYQTQSRLTLIGVLEQLGDYDKALAEVDGLDKMVDAELKPTVLLARGRIQMLKNDKAAAKATLTGLIDAFGTSPEAQKARTMLALLNT